MSGGDQGSELCKQEGTSTLLPFGAPSFVCCVVVIVVVIVYLEVSSFLSVCPKSAIGV